MTSELTEEQKKQIAEKHKQAYEQSDDWQEKLAEKTMRNDTKTS